MEYNETIPMKKKTGIKKEDSKRLSDIKKEK